ncbi:MAG: MotA/TolQ/ExbB proton channel family protein, partial [Bacteroidota bacterium]
MKRLFAFLMLFGSLTIGVSMNAIAQEETETAADVENAEADTTEVAEEAAIEEPAEEAPIEEVQAETLEPLETDATFHQQVKKKFIEGGWEFMGAVLLCLIIGLAISIERIITLNLATTNTKKLLNNVEDALASGGVEAAKEVTKNTRGPVASIFTQGLMRIGEGIDMVEKSIIAYGSVE